MPQMMPMNWLMILMLTTLTLLLFINNLYFNKHLKIKLNKCYKNKLNWKWNW